MKNLLSITVTVFDNFSEQHYSFICLYVIAVVVFFLLQCLPITGKNQIDSSALNRLLSLKQIEQAVF